MDYTVLCVLFQFWVVGLGGMEIERDSPGSAFVEVGNQDDHSQKAILRIVESRLLPELDMYMNQEMEATFNYSVICRSSDSRYRLRILSPEHNVLKVSNPPTENIECADSQLNSTQPITIDGQIRLQLQSGLIGFGLIHFELHKLDGNTNASSSVEDLEAVFTFTVKVLRKMRPVDYIFRIVIYCMQVFVTIGFGVKLDLEVVKKNLKKPIAPGIGFGCQYILMPMIAYGVAKVVTGGNTPVSLGIFVAGCCPGGGGSNMYSFLLNGDLSLSITMTTISTVAALGMLPLWVYTLGSTILEEKLSIPFENIAIALSVIILPLAFGLLLQLKLPKVASKVEMILKPVTVLVVLVLIVVGIYSNLFIFRLFRPRIIIAGCLLPYIGYLMGGLIAFICRQSWTKVKTIAIETGLQNTSIAYILLTSSFAAPLGDIAGVAPMASAFMTPLPPFLATILYITYNKCTNRYGAVRTKEPEVGKGKGRVDGNGDAVEDHEEVQKLTTL